MRRHRGCRDDLRTGRAGRSRRQPLNIGENRFKAVLQLGYVGGFDDDWKVDVITDTTFYGDNDRAGTNGRSTLRQDNSYQFQTWLQATVRTDVWSEGGYGETFGLQFRVMKVF